MQFSKILAVVVLPVSMVLAVPVDQESTGLEARGCKWKNCDECHERDQYCVFCNNGGGIGVSCAVWFVLHFSMTQACLAIASSISDFKFSI